MPASQYPLIRAALSEKQLQRFSERVASLEEAQTRGEIANPIYQDARQSLNRDFQRAWEKHVSHPHIWGKAMSLPEKLDALTMYPEVHTAKGKEKKLEKLKGPEYEVAAVAEAMAAMRSLLAEMRPLADLVEDLKTKTVKRKPASEAEVVPGFTAPRAEPASVKYARELFEGVTREACDKLVSAINRGYKLRVEGYLQQNPVGEVPQSSVVDYLKAKNRGVVPSDDYSILCMAVEVERRPKNPLKMIEGWETALHEKAVSEAKAIQDSFVYKNVRKVASILEGKGLQMLSDVKVIGHSVNISGLSGTFQFSFRDGSSFVATNSVVGSTSVHGKPFLRFPLTFHEVKLPGGEPMKQPSEERMNTVFAGRYYGFIQTPEENKGLLESMSIRMAPYNREKQGFMVEVPFLAKKDLDQFPADFKVDVALRSFEPLASMSDEGLKAERAWHEWANSFPDRERPRSSMTLRADVDAEISRRAPNVAAVHDTPGVIADETISPQ